MQNKRGKPVVTPEMQEFGERLGIDLAKLNSIGTPSITGIVNHIEPTESSAGGTQQQPHSSLRDDQEKSPTGGTEMPTNGTQKEAGTTVQEPDKRPTEGTADGNSQEKKERLPLGKESRWNGFHYINEIIEGTKNERDPDLFWHGFISEGDTNCLFGRSGVGKSTIAVCITEEMCSVFPDDCVWYDAENSYRVIKKRATTGGVRHSFPERCARYQPFTSDHFGEIIKDIRDRRPAFAVVDNLSKLCARLEDPETALRFSDKLQDVVIQTGCTMLAIAHTYKLSETEPIGLYSLGGSAKLINVFQTLIAVAKCHDMPNSVYVKHVKFRLDGAVFDGEDVAILDRTVKDGLLSMEFRRNPDGSLLRSPEFPHLKKTRDQEQEDAKLERMKELIGEGKKEEEVCRALGISRRSYYYLKKKSQEGKSL